MPPFAIGAKIETDSPTIMVDSPPFQPISPGIHRFQLIVRDNDGMQSRPAYVDVIVRDEQAPTAVLDAPTEVPFGQSFELHAERSSDRPPGQIASYQWTMMS